MLAPQVAAPRLREANRQLVASSSDCTSAPRRSGPCCRCRLAGGQLGCPISIPVFPSACCGSCATQGDRRCARAGGRYRNSTTKTRRPAPCFAILRRSTTPEKPERRASSGVMSESATSRSFVTSISPGGSAYRPPTRTWGRCHSRTEQVISPLRTRSRNGFMNCMLAGA